MAEVFGDESGEEPTVRLENRLRQLMQTLGPEPQEGQVGAVAHGIERFLGQDLPGIRRGVFTHEPDPEGELWICNLWGSCWFCLAPEPHGGGPILDP